jgi:hypothetical protein
MRNLTIHEFVEVQGGNLASRILNNASNVITTMAGAFEAYLFLVQKEGSPNYDNFNQLGNYVGELNKN